LWTVVSPAAAFGSAAVIMGVGAASTSALPIRKVG
jgi:hypothetical protein